MFIAACSCTVCTACRLLCSVQRAALARVNESWMIKHLHHLFLHVMNQMEDNSKICENVACDADMSVNHAATRMKCDGDAKHCTVACEDLGLKLHRCTQCRLFLLGTQSASRTTRLKSQGFLLSRCCHDFPFPSPAPFSLFFSLFFSP